jgi:diguanylate cyclase (GGDEF)-like protein
MSNERRSGSAQGGADRGRRLLAALVLWGTVAAALPASAWSLTAIARTGAWEVLLPFVSLAAVAELLRVRIYRARAETFSFSLAVAVTMAAVSAASVAAPLAALSASVVHIAMTGTRRLDKVVFNLSANPLAAGIAAWTYLLLRGPLPGGVVGHLLAAAGAVAAYLVINLGLVSAMVSIHSGRSLLAVARSTGWFVPTNLLLGLTGAFLGAMHEQLGLLGTAVFMLPILVMRFTLAFYAGRSEETIRMLEEQAKDLERMALYDTLTGLPNRRLLQERLRSALDDPEHEAVALLLLNLDRFKEINDTFGHQHGDRLLQQLGPRLHTVLRASDTVARLSGDEFAVLLPGAGVEEACAVAERLGTAVGQPYSVEGYVLEVSASIGIAVAPEHGVDADAVLRRADIAMYVAKRPGLAYAVYAAEHEEQHSPERLALIGELRQAIEQDQLTLHYQPKVDCATGRVVGAEALLRWIHPDRGLIPPDQFIPLAENTGLIRPLTDWVLESAIRQCSAWRAAGMRLAVAVNVSMRNLDDPQLPETIATLLAASGLPPALLSVEVTESSIMADQVRVTAALSRLRAMGIAISVDDFGTGYSALSYLKDLPVDELKIDRSFIRQLTAEDKSAAIVRSTITLGHDLGLRVVAEGVEDLASWGLLGDLACDAAQGYYLSRPLPVAEFEGWVRQPGRVPGQWARAAAAA